MGPEEIGDRSRNSQVQFLRAFDRIDIDPANGGITLSRAIRVIAGFVDGEIFRLREGACPQTEARASGVNND